MSSTGRSETVPEATAGGGDGAKEVAKAAPSHGDVRLEGVGIDDRGYGVGGVVEAVHELEAQSDQQCDAQKDVRQGRTGSHLGEVASQIPADIGKRRWQRRRR